VYAGNDVLYLHRIYSKLVSGMSEERLRSADLDTEKRFREIQQPEYDPDKTRDEMTATNWHYQYEDNYEEPQVKFGSY
jgi:ribonuclease D